MTKGSGQGGSVRIGGDVSNSALIVGNHNVVTLRFGPGDLPNPSSVDIKECLDKISLALSRLESPDQRKIGNALSEAAEEAEKTEPDKGEVDRALGRALEYAKKTESFVTVFEHLRPHLLGLVAWLGTSVHSVSQTLGFG